MSVDFYVKGYTLERGLGKQLSFQYAEFFTFRYYIASAINPLAGKIYNQWAKSTLSYLDIEAPNTKEQDYFNKSYDKSFINFLWYSDSGFKIPHKEAGKLYRYLETKSLNCPNYLDKNIYENMVIKLEHLKDVLYYSYKNRRNVYVS